MWRLGQPGGRLGSHSEEGGTRDRSRFLSRTARPGGPTADCQSTPLVPVLSLLAPVPGSTTTTRTDFRSGAANLPQGPRRLPTHGRAGLTAASQLQDSPGSADFFLEVAMSVPGWLSWLKARSRLRNRARRRRSTPPWRFAPQLVLLEDRCLPSSYSDTPPPRCQTPPGTN